LFIARNIVEAHGGRIEARSEPGSWVEFVFTLPRWVQASAPAEAGLQTGQA
jgi:signal transduction histidine kinase